MLLPTYNPPGCRLGFFATPASLKRAPSMQACILESLNDLCLCTVLEKLVEKEDRKAAAATCRRFREVLAASKRRLRIKGPTESIFQALVERFPSIRELEADWRQQAEVRRTGLQKLGNAVRRRLKKLEDDPLSSTDEALRAFPEYLLKLPCLEVLALLHHYAVESLAKAVSSAPCLKQLRLSRCEGLVPFLVSLKDTNKLTHLKAFGCSDFQELSADSLAPLKRLAHLELVYSESLCSLAPAISELTRLQTLSLHGCRNLKTLPDSIGALPLVRLNLSHCFNLTHIPNSVSSLHSLAQLDLNHCPNLTSLPETLPDSLFLLNLEYCRELSQLPRLSHLQNLRSLYLGDAVRLQTLDLSGLLNLQNLRLWQCLRLVELPESIGECKELRQVNLGGSSLLAGLPESIGQLSKLQELLLWNCQALTELPETLGLASSLRVLDIRDCKGIKQLPDSVLQLKSLTCNILGSGVWHAGEEHEDEEYSLEAMTIQPPAPQ